MKELWRYGLVDFGDLKKLAILLLNNLMDSKHH